MKYFLFFFSFSLFGQQTLKVDFIKMHADVFPRAIEKSITGIVTYEFKVMAAIDTIKIDAKQMEFYEVKINDILVQYKNTGRELQLYQGFKKGKNSLTINYKARPKQTLYFIGEGDNLQIWTQGQGKYTSHWLPSFDDVNEKVIFNIDITFDRAFQVISNGLLKNGKKELSVGRTTFLENNSNATTWKYEMEKPMSSYLVMLAIGKYEKQIIKSKSGILNELYLRPYDKDKFASTYSYSLEIFDFLEREIGVQYPWKIYRQVPVNDFLYAGMENTSATIFSQDFVVDAIGYNDKNYVNVNEHELAHQWFGDLITAKSGEHHWLQEGFATYYSLLAEKEIFGEDHFNFEMFKIANELAEASKTDVIPVLNEKASALSFYKKGAWALFVLSVKIGHKNFQKAVKSYLQKYKFKNVTTDDFLAEVKKVTTYDLTAYKKKWLETAGFDVNVAIEMLSQNKSMKQLFAIQNRYNLPFSEKKAEFESLMKSTAFYPIKEEIIFQVMDIPFAEKKELFAFALQTNNINVRQVIASTTNAIPIEFKDQYESLLLDESYSTREMALTNLCNQFPSDVEKYMNLSKDWIGIHSRNLRIAWLSIALKNPNYQPTKQSIFMTELIDYASSNYDSSIRQNALEALLVINPENENVLRSLFSATAHHKWQFVKFGKDTIRILIKEEKYRKLFQNLLPELSEKEKINLEKLLAE